MLSNALREAGSADKALAAARQALACNPSLSEAHLNEGAALHLQGKLSAAIVSYFLAGPSKAAQANLATALATHQAQSTQAGRVASDDRVTIVRTLLKRPDNEDLLGTLAALLRKDGRLASAACCLERKVGVSRDARSLRDLGAILLELGLIDLAAERLGQALALAPDDREVHRVLGRLHQRRGDLPAAEAHLRTALADSRDDVELLNNLGVALQGQGKPAEASELYRRVLELRPNLVDAHLNLGSALSDQAEHTEAAVVIRRALCLAPERASLHSNLLFALHFDPTATAEAIFDEHLAFGSRFGEPLRASWPKHEPHGDPDKRLRVGYVSADFRLHPVSMFLEPVLRHHDAEQVELFCYSDAIRPDVVTARLQRLVAHFRSSAAWSDEELARRVREDGVDLLVDLAGHTGRNRMLAFARKPAPVQLSWIGYFDTTGLDAIDYRIADVWSVPANVERLFVEQIYRLPRTANCYLPPAPCPEVVETPALRRGHITFGCFNNPAKITRQVVGAFSRILRAVGASRLVLKYGAFDDPGIRARYLGWFAEERISASRIELRGHSSMSKFLASFGDIDIALDPFPYSGETTALHTLWMGVPLVALEGETLVQRMATRVLRIVGLDEWVAGSTDEYVEIAVAAARDPSAIAELRRTLRERLSQSALLDHLGLTRELEAAYRAMWRRRCG
jgi:predicted O-linked N-acetylglucosamine transferase (SPINDLY family)